MGTILLAVGFGLHFAGYYRLAIVSFIAALFCFLYAPRPDREEGAT